MGVLAMARQAQIQEDAVPAGRFVVEADALAEGAEIELDSDHAHQVRDVLRLAAGDALTLLDGVGGEWPATLSRVGRAGVVVRVGARQAGAAEPRAQVVLYQGMLKGAKFEVVLQKGTELGLAAFVPLLCEHGVAGGDELGAAKRLRWRRILVEATEQCGRARVPELAEPCALARALVGLAPGTLAVILCPDEPGTSLRAALLDRRAGSEGASRAGPEVALFVGPEGGFAHAEVALARQAGAVSVTLGPRILRAETAAIVAAALALEARGELG
jgi:16S rRNA (uracil1498-N3)-methyltransferase